MRISIIVFFWGGGGEEGRGRRAVGVSKTGRIVSVSRVWLGVELMKYNFIEVFLLHC